MSVSVTMPQLGESVTEGTVTRWLKKEGEHVAADEPLLEVSTDKVDTEIPSPASGILRGIVVDEDETVAVGAQLAVIEDADESAGGGAPAAAPPAPEAAAPPAPAPVPAPSPANGGAPAPASSWAWTPAPAQPPAAPTPGYMPPPAPAPAAATVPSYTPPALAPQTPPAPAPAAAPSWTVPAPAAAEPEQADAYPEPTPLPSGESPYVTPLVRKLAAEHAVPLETVTGTGVGGRIRKQDVVDAARAQRAAEATAAQEAAAAQAAPAAAPATVAPEAVPAAVAPEAVPATVAPEAAPAPSRPTLVPSALRGTTQRLSRPRQVIAKRMVESLQTSAQLTTVAEVDVTNIARLRAAAKAGFEAREGVKLTFLPFFAQAAVEALKVHPKLNAVIDAEHVGIAVDTERGLMVPVVHNAGDLNIGGLARKISDVAARTRSGQVGPDELSGGTFTLTNTGSRGALFDTPIINQPQVGILGTGTVVRR